MSHRVRLFANLGEDGPVVADADVAARALKRAMIGGLNLAGVNVEDIELATVPVTRFQVRNSGASAGVTVGMVRPAGRLEAAARAPGAVSTSAVPIQIPSWVRPTAAMPSNLPASSSIGRVVASTTSTMREVFSSSTPFITCCP